MSETQAVPLSTSLRDRLVHLRSRFRWVWLAPLLAVIALGCWVFASPLGSAPDDDFHLNSTWCANPLRTDLCEPGPKSSERVVPVATLKSPCYAQDKNASAACLQQYLDKGSAPAVVTSRGSFLNNYPPVFYGFMNLFVSHDILESAVLIRFVNVFLFVGITTALFLLLPGRRRNPLVWGWLISLVPLGLFIIASNNPSAWAVIGVGSTWLALLGYFETTGRRRTALGSLYVITTLMACARGDSSIYAILAAAVVVVITFRRERSYLLRLLLPAAMALTAIVFFFSSQQSAVASSGLSDGSVHAGPLDSFGILAFNLLNVQQLWSGALGGWALGWLDTSMPAIVSVGAFAVYVAVVFLGTGLHEKRKTFSLVFLGLVLWLLPTYVLVRGSNVVGQNVQPRYLLPLIILFAGVAILGTRGRELRPNWVQSGWIVLTLGIAESIALYINLRRYLTGIDVQGVNLDVGKEWWWSGLAISPMGIWILGTLSFTALVAILVHDRMRARTGVVDARQTEGVASAQ